jgi:cytochrome c553
MKVYVTKYALTAGITCHEAKEQNSGVWVSVKFPGAYWETSLKTGRDYAETEQEARAIAVKMRDKKIKSLEKKIAKLKAMTFEVKE